LKIYRIPSIAVSAVNGSNFQIEQQCPQCGAPIILDEADRVLSCKFCRTRVYLATRDFFRFYIPPAPDISEPLYFVPYWRIKGLSYAIREKEIIKGHRGASPPHSMAAPVKEIEISNTYFDMNSLSLDYTILPFSLGLRPQTMTLKFVSGHDNPGKFLKFSSAARDSAINRYLSRTGGAYKQVFIGETISMIYSPVYCANHRIYDAVLKKPLDLQKKETEIEQMLLSTPDEKWHVDFLSLLCPDCGADLPGEKDALILFCNNCQSAWNPSCKDFVKVKYFAWEEKGDHITYLPFWQLKVKISSVQLETYADLIQIANLPKAPAEIWTRTPFYFYAPAFKVNPALFLRWSRQLTATPSPQNLIPDFPAKIIHPVTLPVTEALESTVVTLSSLWKNKRDIQELTTSATFSLEDYSLVLHPFKSNARELIHTKLDVSMDMGALALGTAL
jgi:uncharacterized CHY-type Zn-finger protein